MHSIIPFTAILAGATLAAPTGPKRDFSPDNVYFPLSNGFPNPDTAQVQQIQKDAHGTLSNAPPPPKLSSDGATSLKFVALNEILETAYFTELVYNVTEKLPGYDLGYGHEYVLDALHAIVAQEELHALNANNALKRFNMEPIQPCKYMFPVTNFQDAIAFAAAFTDVVLGTLQDINQIFAKNGDDGLVRGTSSSLGNEGEQEGFFRLVQKKRPSAKPFLTTSTRDFAFSAIQQSIIPGSCPNINDIPLKTFKPLTVVSKDLKPATQTIQYSFAKADAGTEDYNSMRVALINGQNVPVLVPLKDVQVQGGTVSFCADFPYDEYVMDGLTIAAVTKTSGPFTSAVDVANDTLFGPGLIEIN